MEKISAVGIKDLWLADPKKLATLAKKGENTHEFTGAVLAALINDAETEKVENVHQDTWTFEEAEASQDSYRNQLTGSVYRMGVKTAGEISINFTIGQYNYALKMKLLGGNILENGKGWERPEQPVEIYKSLIGKTYDGQYVVLTNTHISAREANTDKAVGLAIKGVAMEHEASGVATEYWFDESIVKAGA